MGQVECVPTTYATEIKETYFEIYTKHVSFPLALPLLNISNMPISTKIHVIVYLHDNNINKFDFMNYAFAKLLLEWL